MSAVSADLSGMVRLARTGAVTPLFGNIDALFAGWCSGQFPENRPEINPTVNGLCHGVLDGLRGTEREAGLTGLVFATTKGEMDEQVRWMRAADAGKGSGVPTLTRTLEELTDAYVIDGPSYVVSTACTSGLVALIEAALLIRDEEAARVIALGADVAGDFVREGFQSLRAISPTRCRPFDESRDGLSLGSAAAGCVLESGAASGNCVLSGWGISNDATHMTAPDRAAGGLIRAIVQALHRAKIAPAEVDVVFAHGTGTRYNDSMECVAIETVFLLKGCSPAVTAAKGFLGHTLGAAGLVEAVLGAEMLHRQVVPPVTGLRIPERRDIDFVTAERHCPVRHVLKIASGFGGMNAAVVLSRVGGGRG